MLRCISASFLVVMICTAVRCEYPGVQEMSKEDFLGDLNIFGKVAAFGDVDSDKQTDVFVISDDGTIVYVLQGSQLAPALSSWNNITLEDAATSVVPADFNGDHTTDLLVTFKSAESSYSVAVYWGIGDSKFDAKNMSKSSETFHDEPLVLDANGDMIADLFVIYSNLTRGFLIGQGKHENWTFLSEPFKTKVDQNLREPYRPHSHAFIDLTGNGSANLFVTAKEDDLMIYEIWRGSPDGLVLHNTINTSSLLSADQDLLIGHVAFVDYVGSAKQDIAVATCIPDGNDGCKSNRILIYSNHDWHVLANLPEKWSFPAAGGTGDFDTTLRIADFNLDSYPDVMTIVQDERGVRIAVIFYNEACQQEYCHALGRQLGANKLVLPGSDDAVLATFYDFNMDGTIDVIVTTESDEHCNLKGYKNLIKDDVTFLRVQVLTDSGNPIYGVNVPGPHIKYKTSNAQGVRQLGSHGQLSQSAHFSLQMPFAIFGLGRLANFVESIEVSIPVPLILSSKAQIAGKTSVGTRNSTLNSDAFEPLKKTWPMLIPNSQLYVIPYPMNSPRSWKNKLLVTPGQNVIMTAVVLLCTCGVLGVVTLILHWLEKREDKQEKIQEAYRFHFDAM